MDIKYLVNGLFGLFLYKISFFLKEFFICIEILGKYLKLRDFFDK